MSETATPADVLDALYPGDDVEKLRHILAGYDEIEAHIQSRRGTIAQLQAERFPDTAEGRVDEASRDRAVDRLRRELGSYVLQQQGYLLCLRRHYGQDPVAAIRRFLEGAEQEQDVQSATVPEVVHPGRCVCGCHSWSETGGWVDGDERGWNWRCDICGFEDQTAQLQVGGAA